MSYRQYYIENNPCKVPDDCPNGKVTCGCDYCAENKGFYMASEIKRNFTPNEAKRIANAFDSIKGYLGIDGCVLPRKLRSFSCLSWSKDIQGCEFK